MTTRALFSLSEEIMDRFRELVPSRERSALIEHLLRKELAEREKLRERELFKLTGLRAFEMAKNDAFHGSVSWGADASVAPGPPGEANPHVGRLLTSTRAGWCHGGSRR